MRRNRLLECLHAGRVPVGHMIMELGTRGIARLLAAAAPGITAGEIPRARFTD